MNLIIFSKDRPLQLDCLIRSIKENCNHFNRITVQYSTKFEESYNILKGRYNDVEFIKETTFKQTFIEIPKDERVCIMVDDDVVYLKVDKEALKYAVAHSDIFSLRLGDDIKKKVHFNYPSSLDGNIFMRDMIEKVYNDDFKNPNELEVKLMKHVRGYKMNSFGHSALKGVPANRVSESSGCDYMNDDIELLDKLFTDGFEIDYKEMDFESSDVHKYIEYAIRLRENN